MCRYPLLPASTSPLWPRPRLSDDPWLRQGLSGSRLQVVKVSVLRSRKLPPAHPCPAPSEKCAPDYSHAQNQPSKSTRTNGLYCPKVVACRTAAALVLAFTLVLDGLKAFLPSHSCPTKIPESLHSEPEAAEATYYPAGMGWLPLAA